MRVVFIVLHLMVIATLQARAKALGPTVDNAVNKEKSSFEGVSMAAHAQAKLAIINWGRSEFRIHV